MRKSVRKRYVLKSVNDSKALYTQTPYSEAQVMPRFKYIAVIMGGTLLASALLVAVSMAVSHVALAEYEAIKQWKEPLICWKVDTNGERTGESVTLLWDNFLTFDENNAMVFLKLNEGLHIVPTKGWICVPESHDDG